MKDYKTVVKVRYDKEKYDGRSIRNNIYSVINPIGFYGIFKEYQILYDYVNLINRRGCALDNIQVCDCGCGDGQVTRILAELLGNAKQVYGVEYSQNRLAHCKKMNNVIHYEYADLTKQGGIPFDIQFDAITSFVVFMHFKSEVEIINALKNIYDSLKNKGLFLWYEANAESHCDGRNRIVDGWGFSTREMDLYAAKVGFKRIKQFEIYTQIPVLNKPTAYLADKIKEIWILELLEKLPFKKNNNVRIYCKG